MARNHSENRCDDCSLFRPLCMCAELKTFRFPTYVSVLMHVRENSLTTNTARLMMSLLENGRTLLRGSMDGPLTWTDPEDWEEGRGRDPLLLFLFPSEDSRDLLDVKAELQANDASRPLHLIVPDGNWKQGAKALKRFPFPERIIPVRLPPGAKSEFVLRKPPRPECVSTFEAIARTLGHLHGPENEESLMHFFRMKQDRLLYARGLKKEEAVCGGIPVSGRKPWH